MEPMLGPVSGGTDVRLTVPSLIGRDEYWVRFVGYSDVCTTQVKLIDGKYFERILSFVTPPGHLGDRSKSDADLAATATPNADGPAALRAPLKTRGLNRTALIELSLDGKNFHLVPTSFMYYAAPRITSIVPSFGAVAVETSVRLQGEYFQETSLLVVAFFTKTWRQEVRAVYDSASGEIRCSAPPCITPGPVSVAITANAADFNTAEGITFTYTPAFRAERVSPACGPLSGGTLLNLFGADFSDTNAIRVRFLAASQLMEVDGKYVDAKTVQCITPAGSDRQVFRLALSMNGRDFQPATGLFFYYPEPVMFGLSPQCLLLSSTTQVVITGSQLLNIPGMIARLEAGDEGDMVMFDCKGKTAAYEALMQEKLTNIRLLEELRLSWELPFRALLDRKLQSELSSMYQSLLTDCSFASIPFTAKALDFESPASVEVSFNGGVNFHDCKLPISMLPVPTVGSISPHWGPLSGGTDVFVHCSARGSEVIQVLFGTPSTEHCKTVDGLLVEGSCYKCVSPAWEHSQFLADVSVSFDGGQHVSKLDGAGFKFYPPPLVTSIEPCLVPNDGGCTVNLCGSKFCDTGLIRVRLITDSEEMTVDASFCNVEMISFEMPALATACDEVRIAVALNGTQFDFFEIGKGLQTYDGSSFTLQRILPTVVPLNEPAALKLLGTGFIVAAPLYVRIRISDDDGNPDFELNLDAEAQTPQQVIPHHPPPPPIRCAHSHTHPDDPPTHSLQAAATGGCLPLAQQAWFLLADLSSPAGASRLSRRVAHVG